jgi:hypothetical protein
MMLKTARRPVQSLQFRSPSEQSLDMRFPRAVAGEEFDRYARAVWSQGQRWMELHWDRVTGAGLSMHDASEVLHGLAAAELGRPLHTQEVQLLGEMLHSAWLDAARSSSHSPEWDGTPNRPAA